jgi:TM2 domain-containing membrane protein YozV
MSEQRLSISFSGEGKNMVLAYLLWFFLGSFGVHRFYLGKIGTGVTQLILLAVGSATSIILIGLIPLAVLAVWWIVDAYFVFKHVRDANSRLPAAASKLSVTTQQAGGASELEELGKLFDLYQKGALTEGEYQVRKSRLMGGAVVAKT